ncbi:DUF4367 domain-containing protein [Thermoanaerobacteraceae bacterium SP2]|nr:DUF4367 domain-containing protein [Thermoanaerobacteraceae bacterium SP2]
MKEYKDEFDMYFSEQIKKISDDIISPDKKRIWLKIKKELNVSKKVKKQVWVKRTLAAAAVLLVFFMGFVAGTGNSAFAGHGFFKTIKSFFGNVVNISGITQTGNDLLHGQEETNAVSEKTYRSPVEAQKMLDYEIVFPAYIPDGYRLSGVFIRDENSRMSSIELKYEASNNDRYFTIEETPVTKPTAFSYNFRKNNTDVKTVYLNGIEATLIWFKKNDTRQLLWHTPAMFYSISGPLAEEEIISIGKSIR